MANLLLGWVAKSLLGWVAKLLLGWVAKLGDRLLSCWDGWLSRGMGG